MTERKMKESGIEWIGKIPDSWDIIKNKYLYHVKGGNGFPDVLQGCTSGDFPFCKNSDINGPEVYICSASNWVTEEIVKLNKFYVAPKNSILYGKIGEAFKKNHRKITAVKCCFDNNVQASILHSTLYDPKYGYYAYRTLDMRDFDNHGTVPTINNTSLLNCYFPLPCLEEQRKIANFLDSKCSEIDALSKDIEKEIETLEEYKKSVITEAVTKGLNPNVEMKDSGIEWIGQIPPHWKLKRTKYIATSIVKGNGITKDQVFEDGNIPCIRYGEIYSKYNNVVNECISRTKREVISSPQIVKKGDILFAGTGELIEEIGKNILYYGDEDCLAGGDIVLLKHSQDPFFLNYSLGSAVSQAQKSRNKAKLKVVHITGFDIGNIYIPVPPIEEQQQIGAYLTNICNETHEVIEKKRTQIQIISEYKKSLIYEYVTGKKEVV